MGSQSFATPEYLLVRNGRFEGVPCSVLHWRRQRRPAGEETVQEAHSRRCPKGLQRQLLRFNQVQGLWKPGDLVTCALLWPIKMRQTLLKGEADPKANYPDCCPVYDCEEGTEVVYVTPPSTKK